MSFNTTSLVMQLVMGLILLCAALSPLHADESGASSGVISESSSDAAYSVMAPFHQQALEHTESDDLWKHEIMFVMGVALLLMVITTAVFGVRMAIFGADVFVPHMVSAGISVFLALAHAVVAIVWFFPY